MPFCIEAALDAMLANIATSTRMAVCSAQPANYAGVAAVTLAEYVMTPGPGNGSFNIAPGGTPPGRKLAVLAQSPITATASGDATYIALHDGSALRYVTTCPTVAVTEDETVAAGAWFIEVAGAPAEEPGGGGGGGGALAGPDEPANFEEVASNDFSGALTDDGWQLLGEGSPTRVEIVQENGFDAMRFRYPAGFQDGGGPGRLVHDIPGAPSQIYFRFKYKFDVDFEGHPVGDKIIYIDDASYGGGGDPFFLLRENQAGSRITVVNQGPLETQHYGMNLVYFPQLNGIWYDIQGHLISGTSGQAHIWLNNGSGWVKTSQHLNVPFSNSSPSWDTFKFEPIWGGFTPQQATHEMYLYIRDAYFSKPA